MANISRALSRAPKATPASKQPTKATKQNKTTQPPAPLIDAIIEPQDFFKSPGRKNHLIEHYMPGPGSVTTIIAGPGVGKTTLIADFAFQFAYKKLRGKHRSFLGQRITQLPAPVLFIAREGHRQLKLLGVAWEQVTQTDFADKEQYEPITVLDESLRPKLDNKEDFHQLRQLLDAFVEKYGNPGIVILDTARKLLSEDENNSKAVTEFMQAAQHIATTYLCSVICLHHTPKSGTPTARGSGAWLSDTDCEWMLSRGKEKTVTIEVTKLKGFELPPPLYFTIESRMTEIEDQDNPGEFLKAANIKQASSPRKKNDGAEASITNILKSPEAKHSKRQESRLKLLHGAWMETGQERTVDSDRPYITRAALAEYLANTMGYTDGTIKQALKPASDAKIKSSLIGPLIADKLIDKHEHGWFVITEWPEQKESAK